MRKDDTVWCDGCGAEILWAPVKANQRDYCCQDCADGFECDCGSRMEEDEHAYDRDMGASESITGGMGLL